MRERKAAMPKPMSWCYIAAFLEADGCISIDGRKTHSGISKRVKVRWVQAEDYSFVLYGIQEFLENKGIAARLYVRKSKRNDGFGRNSPYVSLEVGRQDDVILVLKKILPYMWIKDAKAREALKAISDTRKYDMRKRENRV
jgi:intein/homing endonuclease